MTIPDVRFVATGDSPVNMRNQMSLHQLGFSDTQTHDVCALATQIYREILGRNLPDILLQHAPQEVNLGGFVPTPGMTKSGAAAYVETNQHTVVQRDGQPIIPLKQGPVVMRLGITPDALLSAREMDQIRKFFTHECIHLITRQAISSLMRGPNEAMVIGIDRQVLPTTNDELTNVNHWGWKRELSRATDGFCPPDFQDIDFYNETISALYVAATNVFTGESEAQLWAFAAKLTEVALRKNALPIKAEIEQAVRDVFPKTADAILRSPAFKEVSKEGFQIYWVSNASKQTAVFYPYVQQRIPQGSSRVNPLATFNLKPVRAQYATTFFKKSRMPMTGQHGGGELVPGEVHTAEGFRKKLRESGNASAINVANQIGGISIKVPGTSQTVDLFD